MVDSFPTGWSASSVTLSTSGLFNMHGYKDLRIIVAPGCDIDIGASTFPQPFSHALITHSSV